MLSECTVADRIADGEVDVQSRNIRWSDSSEERFSDFLRDRILYTSQRVCEDLKYYRFDQIVWQNEIPFVVPVIVESIDHDHARFSIGTHRTFSPQLVLGPVPVHAFEQSEQVYLLSDANPSLSPGPQVVYVNQAFEKMTGYKREELIGQTPRILHGEATCADKRASIRTALKQWTPITIEMVNYRKDGTPFNVELDIVPIADAIGWYTFWFAVQRDITNEQLRQQEKIAMAKAAGIAEGATNALHDAGNVLNSIKLTTNQLQSRIQGNFLDTLQKVDDLLSEKAGNLKDFVLNDSRAQQLPNLISAISENAAAELKTIRNGLNEIAANAEHLTAVVTSQNRIAQNSSHQELVSVEEIMNQSLAVCKADLDQQGISIANHIQIGLPHLHTNKHKVVQILANLLKNAAEATTHLSQGMPKISFNAVQELNEIKIQVVDNGIGIDSQKMPQIFERGFTTKSKGCGFGLHSCSSIAKELGGSLTAHSDGENRGAVFEFALKI